MSIYYQDSTVQLHHGDCLEVLRSLPDASVDSVCTDPPYGLANTDPAHVVETITRWINGERDYLPGGSGFMGKAWDSFVPPVAVWDECLRVLKPGGHVLAFAGSRTVDLMTLGLRLAGFDIRDSVAWLYGSGFPKSLDVSKAIEAAERSAASPVRDALAADLRGVTTTRTDQDHGDSPAEQEFTPWQGWGTALKPAHEPVVMARKPLSGTVAQTVLAHGTGGLNIGGCRVGDTDTRKASHPGDFGSINDDGWRPTPGRIKGSSAGRWPANVILDESQAATLDEQSGELTSGVLAAHHQRAPKESGILGAYGSADGERGFGDSGGASRFFYVAKADASERVRVNGTAHPTVKPLALMRWLVRLVTPPGGTVLEPFAGSGTTVEACILEGFHCIAIERETEYLPLIRQRIDRRRDPVAAVKTAGEDGGLFDLLGGGAA